MRRISLAATLVALSACSGHNTQGAPPGSAQAPATQTAEPAPTPSATTGSERGPAAPDSPSATTAPGATSGANPDTAALLALGPEASRSVGSPTEGHLEGSVALPLRGPGFRFNPDKDPRSRHGTVELVQALIRAAAAVEREAPGDVLTINDLSMPKGGVIPGHASHRSGRDVDVLFYLRDGNGDPFPSKPIPLEPGGTGTDYKDLADPSDDVPVRMDVDRTWRFVEALVLDPNVELQRILVAEHLRALLLRHARDIEAPRAAIQAFATITCQPNFPHDDHFHIRVFCSPDDIAAGCLDTRPIYPWHRRKLARAGATPKLAGRRKSPRPKLKSHAEAKAEARERYGSMHSDVLEFLERRKAWQRKPHPGRRYCR